LIDVQLHNIWNNKTIPLITWQLFECDGSKHPGVIKLVNNNTYDTYINQFGDRLKKWLAGNDSIYGNDDDRRAYLRLGMKFEAKVCSNRKTCQCGPMWGQNMELTHLLHLLYTDTKYVI
jgi:hypothetical protein